MAKTSYKPRVIFAGTAQFAVPALEKLLKIADICLVLTQHAKPAGRGLKETPCPVDLFAQENHLPIYRPTSLKQEIIGSTLADYACDYFIVAAYGKILPQWLLNFPKYRALNLHGSLLPRWRGASPIQHAILAGDKLTGVNLMEMTLGMDEGPIISTATCPLKDSDSLEGLTKKLGELGAELLVAFIKSPQVKAMAQEGEPTYAPKISKSMGQIDWATQTASAIQRAFRAFTPWPGLYSWTTDDFRIKILGIGNGYREKTADDYSLAAGTLKIEGGDLWALCQDRWIMLTLLQMEGKNSTLCSEALKDHNHWIRRLQFLKDRKESPNV
jgi:methionyl-tRNA formyltransferase